MLFHEYLLEIVTDVTQNKFQLTSVNISILNYWQNHLEQFMRFFYCLNDDASKQTFLQLLKFRMAMSLSGTSVHNKYSLYPNEIWNKLQNQSQTIKHHVENDYILDRIETFILEGYNYQNICCAEQGDYVLDCGAYTGNTALYFADKVGTEGRVYAFEAMPTTYAILCKNIEGKNVYCLQNAVSKISEIVHFTNTASAGSRITNAKDAIEVEAVSIDDFVEKNQLPKVDFIKMDIEGAELNALQGAIKTCRKFLPKLAICIYHKNEDWITIPEQILEISNKYRLYLKHNSNNFLETVLFALPTNTEQEKLIIDDKDLENTKKIWLLFDIFYKNKQQSIREKLLNLYVAKSNAIHQFKFTILYDNNNFHYVYFPLSDDQKLHYEFCFKNSAISVCLHFEGQWKNFSKIHEEFQLLDKLQSKVEYDHLSFGDEICYTIKDIYDIDFVAGMMDFLIVHTFPILQKHGLISDKISIRQWTQAKALTYSAQKLPSTFDNSQNIFE